MTTTITLTKQTEDRKKATSTCLTIYKLHTKISNFSKQGTSKKKIVLQLFFSINDGRNKKKIEHKNLAIVLVVGILSSTADPKPRARFRTTERSQLHHHPFPETRFLQSPSRFSRKIRLGNGNRRESEFQYLQRRHY